MSWNHRILAHEDNGEIYFQIHEVYYKRTGKPKAYTEKAISVGGYAVKDIKWVLNRMKEATKKPILWAGKKWPKEYTEL